MKSTRIHSLKLFSLLCLFNLLCLSPQYSTPAFSQEDPAPETALQEPTEEQIKQREQETEAREALTTLNQLLKTSQTQKQSIKKLKAELRAAKEDVTKKEIEAALKIETTKEEQINEQITALTAGISDKTFFTEEKKEFNLQDELQSLAEPFVKMIKSSTETARQIDSLKITINDAQRQQSMAKQALERINSLQQNKTVTDKTTSAHLAKQKAIWEERLKESVNLQSTSEQQLTLKEKAVSTVNLENYATNFFRSRGVNLLIALAVFIVTFMLLRFINMAIGHMFHRASIKHTFYSRLARFLFQGFTVIASTLMMMITLNYLNDWILLGVVGLFAIALAWISLKMMPAIMEQTVLLLNLGAVQEGERLLLDGVPWLVKRLDHYTELVNPALDGGHFSVPIRQLVGMHSRPPARNEAWFPTKKDDWVLLETGGIAKVIIQTPEFVQLIEPGGIRKTYATADFITIAPCNISTGFRIRTVFGVSYKHQKQSTDEIPNLLKEKVRAGLHKLVEAPNFLDIKIELTNPASSSIDYLISTDFTGKLAPRYNELKNEILCQLIAACNENDLEIPFPQMVIHKA